MKKEVYFITGYIPSDEDIPCVNIYKLVRLGNKTIKYIWISLTRDGGYGTSTDLENWADTESEAILQLLTIGGVGDRYYIKHTFEEAYEKYQDIEIMLNAEIEAKNKIV